MPPIDEARIRELLGVEEDADVEATIRDLRTRADATATPPAGDGTTPPAGDTTTPPAGAATPPAGTPAPPAGVTDPAAPAGSTTTTDERTPELVTLTAGVLEQLQRDAAAGAQAAATLLAQERDRVLEGAIRQGRIAPAERDLFAAQLERDHASTVTLLNGLTPRFPVSELGGNPGGDQLAADDDQAWGEFLGGIIPELKNATTTATK